MKGTGVPPVNTIMASPMAPYANPRLTGERLSIGTWLELARWARSTMMLATANVVGGWFVTDRMLEMFKRRPEPKREESES